NMSAWALWKKLMVELQEATMQVMPQRVRFYSLDYGGRPSIKIVRNFVRHVIIVNVLEDQ
ncbi:hypothetical protein KI387_021894, partial [Taxus chinensis]